jgi:predicted nucleotidyltransferase
MYHIHTSNLPSDFDRFMAGLVEQYRPERVVLFGSYARREERPGSDVDLLVVLNHEGKNPYLAADIHTDLRPNFPMDLLVRKPQEIEERLDLGDRFIRDILKEGIVIYEGDQR